MAHRWSGCNDPGPLERCPHRPRSGGGERPTPRQVPTSRGVGRRPEDSSNPPRRSRCRTFDGSSSRVGRPGVRTEGPKDRGLRLDRRPLRSL